MKIRGNNLFAVTNGQVGRFKFDVGILKDGPKRLPKYGTVKQTAGMRVLAKGKLSKTTTLIDVARWLNTNPMWLRWLSRPFAYSKNNKDIVKVVGDLAASFGKSKISAGDRRRLENGIQAIVRNPIRRKDYRRNKLITEKRKGFNHMMVATGELYDAIKAKLTNV